MPAREGEGRERGVSLPRDWSSVRELRKARGLSQTRLAELSGVSERMVRAIESGTVEGPQHESLRRIAAVLAYGASHQKRLLDRWTRSQARITPDDLGIPDWEALFRRMGTRKPADGGLMSTVICELTVGADRLPQPPRYSRVHEQMSVSGPPVVWKPTSGLPFDLGSVRFEVWSVRGASATTGERQGRVQVPPNGCVQVCFQDLVGLFGLQWEWGDER